MTPRRLRAVAAVGLAAALGAIGASSASARGITTGFYDPIYQSPQSAVRATWLGRTVDEDAGIVRLTVVWRDVAGGRPQTPTNPSDPAYDWSRVDPAVRDARARHLQVMLTIQNAPSWAEGPGRPRGANPGSWKPNPRAFGEFAEAVARRYSGAVAGLPRVRFFQAWTEQNLGGLLLPLFEHGRAVGPERYRRMLNAFYAGVKRGQPGAKVVTGGLAPFGNPPGAIAPLTFLRQMLCLNGKLRPTCSARSRFDILAMHPINPFGSPFDHARNRNDVATADMGRVRRVLRAAERKGHVRPRRHHPLWATELFWFTKPPNRNGIGLAKQARFIQDAFYVLWKAGVSVVMNFEIRDQPYNPHASLGATLQSGTFFHSGRKKPSFKSFRFPFVVPRHAKHALKVWLKAPRSGRLRIQSQRGGRWQTTKALRVRRGQVVTTKVKRRGVRIRGKVGGITSLPRRLPR